jgi:hypothetical protein
MAGAFVLLRGVVPSEANWCTDLLKCGFGLLIFWDGQRESGLFEFLLEPLLASFVELAHSSIVFPLDRSLIAEEQAHALGFGWIAEEVG